MNERVYLLLKSNGFSGEILYTRKAGCEKNVFILKVLILNLNQLLGAVNSKDSNTDYYITISTLASRYHGSIA